MPLYRWSGINDQGIVHSDTLIARSDDDLKHRILKKGFALIRFRKSLIKQNIKSYQRRDFYFHLSSHLMAHIPLHSALLLCASTQKNRYCSLVIEDIALMVAEGKLLSNALHAHDVSDQLLDSLIRAGENTGNLSRVLQQYVQHQDQLEIYKNTLRSRLLMPLITLVFFLVLLVGIFTFVIPHFESYYKMYNAQLPPLTLLIIQISTYLRSSAVLVFALSVCALIFLFLQLKKIPAIRLIWHKALFIMPVIRNCMLLSAKKRILQSLSLLLGQHIPLTQALNICLETTKNSFIKEELRRMIRVIERGQLLSMALHESVFAEHQLEAYIKNGETTGNLAHMVSYSADLSQKEVYHMINYSITLVQPLLVLLLGILVAMLIFAVYMPILTLSSLL